MVCSQWENSAGSGLINLTMVVRQAKFLWAEGTRGRMVPQTNPSKPYLKLGLKAGAGTLLGGMAWMLYQIHPLPPPKKNDHPSAPFCFSLCLHFTLFLEESCHRWFI